MPLVGEQLHHDAEIARIILESAEGADVWVGLRGQIRVDGAGRGLERERLGEIERLARDDVDRACDAAFHQRGARALLHHHRADDFRGQQGVADAASHRARLVEDQPLAPAYILALYDPLGYAGTPSPP